MKLFIAACVTCLIVTGQDLILTTPDAFTPARFRAGTVPDLPVLAVGGGQVFVELGVGADGRVATVSALRTTPPFTDFVVPSVRDWQFKPAEELQRNAARPDMPPTRKPVASRVLVAAVFRAPTLNVPTLGEAPRDVAFASADSAFPLTVAEPLYPPAAYGRGVVMVEARLDPTGSITDVAIVRSSPPFDDAARAALQKWSFLPARVRGTRVPTYVYIIFGFPIPITSSLQR